MIAKNEEGTNLKSISALFEVSVDMWRSILNEFKFMKKARHLTDKK